MTQFTLRDIARYHPIESVPHDQRHRSDMFSQAQSYINDNADNYFATYQ